MMSEGCKFDTNYALIRRKLEHILASNKDKKNKII